jgi:hypothetical protein
MFTPLLPSTCCYGPDFEIIKDITKGDIYKIFLKLKETFGDEYDWEPEGICEGGFVCKKWPGKKEREYKSIRFNIIEGGWPWVCQDFIKNCKETPDEIIWPKQKQQGHFFLKAFYGAPCWTLDEVKIITSIIGSISGIICKKKSFPQKKDLKQKLHIY